MVRRAIALIVLLVAVFGIFIYYAYREPINITTEVNTASDNQTSYEVNLIHKFELPEILKEVSGIYHLSKDHFACVQDEKGIIFIYKTDNESIEKEIRFAHDGDYEDLVIADNNAYVIKSDGILYEIKDFTQPDPEITSYKLSIDGKANLEGLCYDKNGNRLLISQKDKSKNWKNYKNIFAFNLSNKKIIQEPVFKIDINNELFKNIADDDVISPSGIAIHPTTGEIYVLEGKDAKLLVMNNDGSLKALYILDEEFFPQPEGIAFSSNGELFISNEGQGNNPGNILQLEITEKALNKLNSQL